MHESTRRRGRPRAFDTDRALAQIIDVFRKSGFDAASLDDISAATGLSRPSLYAAFGNKTSLYLNALERFSALVTEKAVIRSQAGEPLEKALKEFFYALIELYAPNESGASGCLTWGTAPAATQLQDVKACLAEAISLQDKTFLSALPKHTSEERILAAAELLSNTVIGVSTRIKAGTSPAEIRAHTDRVSALIASALDG